MYAIRSYYVLFCAERMEEEVRSRKDALAAAIVEPLVQGAAGMLLMPDGYLARLRAVTRECGVLLSYNFV